jgi:(S)-2-hydroxyglutarate dehydrogenase
LRAKSSPDRSENDGSGPPGVIAISAPSHAVTAARARPQFEVAVVGGGIVGLSAAMALVEDWGCRVVVLEAEARIAAHQTGHNSGVIHAGVYYRPGSLKARLCAEGRDAMYDFCRSENIPHSRCGKLIVATDARELARLDVLETRARENGLREVSRLGPGELREREPEVAGVGGLWVGETGIVDFGQVAAAYAARVQRGGGMLLTGARVTSIRPVTDWLALAAGGEPITASLLLNCAGLHADRVARLSGVDPGVRIVPFRGEYYQLTAAAAPRVRGLIYPVPDPALPFLGVHFTRRIDGSVEAGPNAVLALRREGYRRFQMSATDLLDMARFPGFWRMARRQWRTGLAEYRRSFSRNAFLRSLQRLMPGLESTDLAPGGSGVRAQAVDRDGRLLDDFSIHYGDRAIHVLNAPSPAATASIAIGRVLAREAASRVARHSSHAGGHQPARRR